MASRHKGWLLAAGIALAGAAVTGGAAVRAADEGPKAKGVVAVRESSMKANGEYMNAIKAVLTEYPDGLREVPVFADAIAASAGHTPEWFPKGSDQAPTKALPAVWEKPDDFKAAAKKAQDLAMKLAETAKGGDQKATLAAFGALGKEGCGGCHQTFRKRENS